MSSTGLSHIILTKIFSKIMDIFHLDGSFFMKKVNSLCYPQGD